jgi:hypothetical protein
MDAAPDAPADSPLDERRPKGTPEEQLAALGPDPAEAAELEPDEPEEDLKAADAPELARPSSTTPNATQPSRSPTTDSAAAPVSPPAADRTATTSARADTSQPQQLPTPPQQRPESQTVAQTGQIPQQDDQRPQGTAPISATAMAVGALASAFRRPETQSQPAAPGASQPATPAAPATPPASAARDLLSRFAVRNILETLRGPQDQNRAAPPASTLSTATDPAPPPGGLRDKLTSFTAERLQPQRDAEQVQGATHAATGVIASLQALEQQETSGILNKIRDAAKANGGIENVLSEMRPGGQFEDLRKEFNTVLSHDQGFAAAYDKATGTIADYAETRAAVPPPTTMRGDPNLARLQTLDHEIAEAAKNLPGLKDGQSAFEDLAQSGREAVQKLFSAVQQVFSQDADLRGPSPSPSLGR